MDSHTDNKQSRDSFVYLIGCARSGTYLLTRLIDEHFSVKVPFETHFIPLFNRFLFLWGDLRKYNNRKRLLECIYDFLEIFTHALDSYDVDMEKIKEHTLLVTKNNQENILENSFSYPELVCNLFREYARTKGAERYGDKSAFFQHFPMEKVQNEFDNLKVIHIIRDGRDVSLSWGKVWFGPISIIEAAKQWSAHVINKHEWGQNNPDIYMELRYEDLLETPDEYMAKISTFLGYPTEESTGESSLVGEIARCSTHSLLSGPLEKGNREKWKTEMPEKDILRFDYFAHKALTQFGYSVKEATTLEKITYSIQGMLVYPVYTFSARNLKRKLKSLLPLVLFVSNIIHFPIRTIFEKFAGKNQAVKQTK